MRRRGNNEEKRLQNRTNKGMVEQKGKTEQQNKIYKKQCLSRYLLHVV